MCLKPGLCSKLDTKDRKTKNKNESNRDSAYAAMQQRWKFFIKAGYSERLEHEVVAGWLFHTFLFGTFGVAWLFSSIREVQRSDRMVLVLLEMVVWGSLQWNHGAVHISYLLYSQQCMQSNVIGPTYHSTSCFKFLAGGMSYWHIKPDWWAVISSHLWCKLLH